MLLDLHVHSRYSSDAITMPETAVKAAKKLGIGFALTDHNTTAGWRVFSALAKKNKIPLVLGEELKVYSKGEFCGELMGLFMNSPVKSKEYMDVIDELHSQGALVNVPHPFDAFRRHFDFSFECRKKIDLFEVFNSRTYFGRYNKQAERFAEKHKIPMVAGSDAHLPREIGNAYTAVDASGLEEARKLLAKGKCTWSGRPAGLMVHVQTFLAKRRLLAES